jgi:class 3 adenylate cyclase
MDSPLEALLARLGLERLGPLFAENEVDLDTLRILSEADLQELDIPFGPRKKLLNALADLGSTAAATEHSTADARRERRYLTVLFSDMVDFTALASRVDPEELDAVIRTYEDTCIAAIERYDGYVHNRLGDGIIAFFGYPLAHERGAERSIRAGLEILERLANTVVPAVDRVQARVGIAAGVVLVSPADQTAIGETLNLASRLQNVAGVGQVAVSSRVRRLAGDVFDYADMGEIELKGIPQPVRTYIVRGAVDVESRFDATHREAAPFVGRTSELERLDVAWTSALVDAGRVACLVGEAGIGKSRLVRAARDRAALDNARTVLVQCSPYHEHSAYYPIAEALRRLLDIRSDTSIDDALVAVARLAGQYGLPDDDVARLGVIVGMSVERAGAPKLSARDEKERTVAAIVRLVEAVARASPSLLVVEDLHWADPSTLDVLDELVAGVERLSLLAIVTQRPEAPRRWSSNPAVETLELQRFDDDHARALIEQLVAVPLPPGLVDLVVERADGIPLFIEELATSAVEELAEHGVTTELGTMLPITLRDLLANRLDRLGPAKSVAQLGAVIGRDFSIDQLRMIADQSAEVLDAQLAGLQRSGLAGPSEEGRPGWFTFKHALVRDAAYESIPRSRRIELHGRLATALLDAPLTPPELIARHLTAAGDAVSAVTWWGRAGDRARDRFALAESVAHYTAGLGLVPQLSPGADRDREELRLRSSAAPALVAVRGWASPEVAELLGPAVPLAEDSRQPDKMLPVIHGLWVHHMSAGKHDVALGWARRQLALADEHDDEILELNAHRGLMTSHFWRGDLRRSLEHGDRIRERYDPARHGAIAEVTNADPYTADGSYRCQSLWMLGHPDQARAVSVEKDEFARRRNHPFDLCFALTIGALTFDYRGEPEELLARTNEAIRIGRQHRVPLMSEMMAQIITGIGQLRGGRIGESIDQISHSLAALRGTGHRAWVPYVHAVLGEAMSLGGDLEAGRAEIVRAVQLMRSQGEHVHLPEALRLHGWVTWKLGDVAEGEAILQRSVDVAVEQGARAWHLRTLTTLAELQIDRGDDSVALRALGPLFDSFTEGAGTADHVCAAALLERAAARAATSARSASAGSKSGGIT